MVRITLSPTQPFTRSPTVSSCCWAFNIIKNTIVFHSQRNRTYLTAFGHGWALIYPHNFGGWIPFKSPCSITFYDFFQDSPPKKLYQILFSIHTSIHVPIFP